MNATILSIRRYYTINWTIAYYQSDGVVLSNGRYYNINWTIYLIAIDTMKFKRQISYNIEVALKDTPVVFMMGPRQVGKTTLAKNLVDPSWGYVTLDDQTQFEIASSDPIGFIRHLSQKRVVIDEVQRVPDLFVAIKQIVDETDSAGQFLLTGSTNALFLPKLSDSLAGRMETIPIKPLSECELNDSEPSFLYKVLEQQPLITNETRVKESLLNRLIVGCFPKPLLRANQQRSQRWYQQYIDALIQRDIRDIEDITHPDKMTHLLKLITYYSSKLLNRSQLSQKTGLHHQTIDKYLGLLQQLFLVEKLPAWHTNEYKRLVKTPKIHAIDTGLACAARGITYHHLANQPKDLGLLLETFVYNELRKQADWLDQPVRFCHYRDKDQVEVDIIIEDMSGCCHAIEIKAAATLKQKDFEPLKRFQKVAGPRFKTGILLYDGDHVSAFGDGLYAVPIAALWR